MSNPFVAEIRIFGFNFAPTGWALCNGQILPISQNTAPSFDQPWLRSRLCGNMFSSELPPLQRAMKWPLSYCGPKRCRVGPTRPLAHAFAFFRLSRASAELPTTNTTRS
jgi:hypothetical protein